MRIRPAGIPPVNFYGNQIKCPVFIADSFEMLTIAGIASPINIFAAGLENI